MTTIGFIGGTGPEGKGLAYRFALAGHEIVIGPRRLERAQEAAQEIAPAVRFTVQETTDVAGDVQFLRSVRLLLDEHPGQNRVRMRVVTLDRALVTLEWRAFTSRDLRHALARLLAERAKR